MRAVILGLALAIVLGAITHIVVVLLVPRLAPLTIADRLESPLSEAGFSPIDRSDLFLDRDPNLLRRVCAFDLLNASAMRVEAEIPSGYWSVSVHDRFGLSYALLNDRAAQDGTMRLVIATRRQARALADEEDERLRDATVVRLAPVDGYIVLRALVDRPSQQRVIEAALDRARCELLDIDVPPPRPQSLEELIGSAPSTGTGSVIR